MAFRIGDIVVDARTGKIGQLMGREGPDVQLRPVRGGLEWDCPREAIRAPEPTELLARPAGPPAPRCAVCASIKDQRREAETQGDVQRMSDAAARMGVHQRQAHAHM
ncbi:hypothetical protein [Streptomyces ehimensis]|uniref:Uncharacterized protein n=1 Tax=Streptomyces ehimensis TaxID=68195 RepID=A0ABV9BB30_9ACTN